MATLTTISGGFLVNDTNNVFTTDVTKVTTNDDGSVAHLDWDGGKYELAWSAITGDAQTNYNSWIEYLEGETF